ncbi:MAG: sodium:proton antiporter, partial [Oscillospiraceae bacterium]|nr:sodium:proton antiporter [Oscillospiraceae bacterium]
MSFAANLPLFSIVACLLCSVLSSVLPERGARWLSRLLALAVALGAAAVLGLGLEAERNTLYLMGHFPHPWGNELRFGLLEPLFAGVFALVLLLCLWGGSAELERDIAPERRSFYYVMADLVLAALLSLCYTNDIFTGYVFIEICTIASCGLLMIRRIGRTTLASTRYMIFSLVGSGLFLLGVILLYGQTGHLLFPNLRQSVAELWATGTHRYTLLCSVGLITVGLGV